MNKNIRDAKSIIDGSVRDKFENIWLNVVENEIDEYRILLWGSITEDNKDVGDLDILFEHKEHSITDNMIDSIEGQIKSLTYTKKFDYIDPNLIHYSDLDEIISNSRTSRVYYVDRDKWIEFE